jgi:cellulose synthase/poly-beta-1,6-N-acetylglucosamine synthase-like glycosyltransferase
MGAPPLVTVVIPTCNRRAMLEEAIESVLAQDAVDALILVVDDGSTDGTVEWLSTVESDGLRWFPSPGRERTVARNAGLAVVTSPYVLFLDDDDRLAPQALARLSRALARHPRAIAAAGTYATFGQFGPEEVPRRQPIGRLPIARRMWREVLSGWYLLPGLALWRADELRALGGWDESRTFAEDLELSLRIHPRTLALVPHEVLRYRQHGRMPDRALERHHARMNAEVVEAFERRLSGREARAARRLVRARPLREQAMAAYAQAQYGPALRGLVRSAAIAPSLVASPVLGPTVVVMMVRSLVALVLPSSVRQRVRAARVARRASRFGASG